MRFDGKGAVQHEDMLIASSGRHQLFYIPFEYVERAARLVIVGITPGKRQLELAYGKAQELLRAGVPEADLLRQVKAHAAFGGHTRTRLLKMLRHFGFASRLGIRDEADLWGGSAYLLHSTSVVPHAAFEDGEMFNGTFDEVLASPALRNCFENSFIPELAVLPSHAVFIGLGDTPLAALEHCAARGLMSPDRVLGAFAHPSGSSGSEVDVYIGARDPSTLNEHDPVRHRVRGLLAKAERMRRAVAQWSGNMPPPMTAQPTLSVQAPCSGTAPPSTPIPTNHRAPNDESPTVSTSNNRLHAFVSRGPAAGTVLRPHVHEDGCYVVSPTRFEKDYIRVPAEEPLEGYLRRGLRLRMSAPGRAPSLITPESIRGMDV